MKSEAIRIDRATAADVDGILKLAEDNYPERGGELTGHLARETVAGMIQQLPNIVARRGEDLVGFLLVSEKTSSRNPCVISMLDAYGGSDDAYVYGPVCVHSSARGQGIAQAMFEQLRRLVPNREGILFIKASNASSLRAHRKMGMRTTAEYTYEGNRFVVFAYGP